MDEIDNIFLQNFQIKTKELSRLYLLQNNVIAIYEVILKLEWL